MGNEQGFALVIVLIMILLLSILGATVLNSTTSDIRMTGDYRNRETAFFAADAGLEFAESYGLIYSSMSPTSTTWPGDSSLSSTEFPGYFKQQVGDHDSASTAYVKVDFVKTGAVPAGMGTEADSGLGSGTGFMANFYVVSAIGVGPNNASRAEVEAEVVKIVPK